MNMEQTECSETSAYKIQTPGYHPKESIQHSGHGESLKSKILFDMNAERGRGRVKVRVAYYYYYYYYYYYLRRTA